MEDMNGRLHSLSALRNMEVIDVNTGIRLGYIKDIVIDIENKRVDSLILPLEQKRMFSRGEDFELPWDKVVKAGVDVILIDGNEYIDKISKNNI